MIKITAKDIFIHGELGKDKQPKLKPAIRKALDELIKAIRENETKPV